MSSVVRAPGSHGVGWRAMSADPALVVTERRSDGVAVVRLDNPKVNALSTELLRQLEAAAEALMDDPPGAVVISGGDRLFAAGAGPTAVGGRGEARAGRGGGLGGRHGRAGRPRGGASGRVH